MFTNDVLEQSQDQIYLSEVSSDSILNLINFMYTGELEINNENVQDLFTASSFIQMTDICKECSVYMTSELHVSNCVGIFQFARFHSDKTLADEAARFCIHHFSDILKFDDLLELSAEDLEHFIKDDDLDIANEIEVWYLIERWVQHHDSRLKNLSDLLRYVRLDLINKKVVEEMIKNAEIIKNCKLSFAGIDKYLQNIEDSTTLHTSTDLRLGMYSTEMFVFVGGGQHNQIRAFTAYEPNSKKNYWAIPMHIAFDFKFRMDYHRIVVEVTSGLVYLIGGILYKDLHLSDECSALRELRCFKPYDRKWEECAKLTVPRCAHTAESVGSYLYAIGGKSRYNSYGPILRSCERYDCSRDVWYKVASLPIPLYHHSSVVYSGDIYVVGGYTTSDVVSGTILQYSIGKIFFLYLQIAV